MTVWQPGDACLVWGDWPAHVLTADRLAVRVRFLGGTGPTSFGVELIVRPQLLQPVHLPGELRRGRRFLDNPGWFEKERNWNARDLLSLRALWPTKPHDELAAHFGRSVESLRKAALAWYGVCENPHVTTYSSQQVVRLLGISPRILADYIRRGFIPVAGIRQGHERVIEQAGVERFLRECRELYVPERITEDPYRTQVAALEAADPYLDAGQAAALYGIARVTMQDYCRLRKLPGRWGVVGSGGRVTGGWRIPRSWLLQPDPPQLVRCRVCRRDKLPTDFYRREEGRLNYECRVCCSRRIGASYEERKTA